MKKQVITVLAIASLAGVTGCQNTVNTIPGVVHPVNLCDYVGVTKPCETDFFLTGRLKIVNITASQTEEGLYRVQVMAQNVRTGVFSQFWSWFTDENPYPVDFRFTWYDKDGVETDSHLTLWKKQMIYPGEFVTFTSVTPTKECQKFHLNVKESQ